MDIHTGLRLQTLGSVGHKQCLPSMPTTLRSYAMRRAKRGRHANTAVSCTQGPVNAQYAAASIAAPCKAQACTRRKHVGLRIPLHIFQKLREEVAAGHSFPCSIWCVTAGGKHQSTQTQHATPFLLATATRYLVMLHKETITHKGSESLMCDAADM